MKITNFQCCSKLLLSTKNKTWVEYVKLYIASCQGLVQLRVSHEISYIIRASVQAYVLLIVKEFENEEIISQFVINY